MVDAEGDVYTVAPMSLSPDEIDRYARHLVLRDVGGPGQLKLKAARVLVIGAGPSGLVAIKECREVGLDVVCLEAQPWIGGLWRFTETESHSSVYRYRLPCWVDRRQPHAPHAACSRVLAARTAGQR